MNGYPQGLADRIKLRSRNCSAKTAAASSSTDGTNETPEPIATSNKIRLPDSLPLETSIKRLRTKSSRPSIKTTPSTAISPPASATEWDSITVSDSAVQTDVARAIETPPASSATLSPAMPAQIHAMLDLWPSPVTTPSLDSVPLGAVRFRSTARFHDVDADRHFVEEMQSVLVSWNRAKRADNQKHQARRISGLLSVATPPLPNVDAHFATVNEAEHLVGPNVFFNGPIFTEGQQGLPLQTVDQFLAEFYDDRVLADIQDPAMSITPCTRRVPISQVKTRLLKPGKATEKPWNLLEIATHADEGIKPSWLNGEDCRLITKLKIPESQKTIQRRGYQPGYKEVERWALLAQAGALTNPHQDSHGYSTFITCNQGEIGFGWLSHPTAEERAGWERSPDDYVGGRWRYVVLRPGQTVYFPAGTVHFVFRVPSRGNTLAFGGHILRCSTLVHWVKTLLAEKRAVNVSNEDLSVSAPGYLDAVEAFLKQAQKQGTVDKWGGVDAIQEFLTLKQEFMST